MSNDNDTSNDNIIWVLFTVANLWKRLAKSQTEKR